MNLHNSRIENEIRAWAHHYTRSGGKVHRKRQVELMIRIALDIAKHENINSVGQIGKKHIERYWKRHEGLAESTRRDREYAIGKLTQL